MVIHTTTEYETWDYLAKKYYDNEYLFGLIIRTNPNYADKDILPAGVEIIIPELKENDRKKVATIW